MATYSLQQTELTSFASADYDAVAFLRRSCTVLTFNSSEYFASVYRQDEKGKWKRCGTWNLPASDRVIGFFALESFYYFLVLTERNGRVAASFLDINSNLLNTVILPNSSGVRHADFDQKRKELLLISNRYEIKNFAVRLVIATLKGGESDSSFHVIYRMQTKIPDNLQSVSHQMICQDVSGCTMILLTSGCILCFETSSLEILWHIDANRFVEKPKSLFADKFGPSFVVFCQNLGDQVDNFGHLEFWTPPTDFQHINSSLFERSVIPLQSDLIHLHIESVGDDYLTSIMIIENSHTAQYWIFNPVTKQLGYHCRLNFNGPESCLSPFEIEINRPVLFPGIGSFLSASGLPGCKVLFIGFSRNGVCTLALHSPCSADKNWMYVDQMLSSLQLVPSENLQDHQEGVEEFLSPNVSLRPNASPVMQHSPQQRMSVPSVTTMNDSLSLDEEVKQQQTSLATKTDRRVMKHPSKASLPGVLFFLPASTLSRLFERLTEFQKDHLFQIITPTGLALLSDTSYHQSFQNKSTHHHPELEMKRLCRHGLCPTSSPIDQSSSLCFKIVQVACRSSMLVLITDIKEGFVYNLESLLDPLRSEPPRPIRLELEIRPQAHVSSLMVSDILIRINPNQSDQIQRRSLEGPGAIGTHILTMVGDTDGNINFSVCSLTAVLHQGSIRAHTSPIVSILSTGDASRNLWKVGTRTSAGPLKQVQPKPCPGSAIVSLSREGELKVWQPIFSQHNSARSNPLQILSIYQLSWKISGLMMVASRSDATKELSVTSACIDPACLSCIVGTSDGVLTQWPLPGLVNRSNGKVQIGKSFIWQSKRHRADITHLSMQINLSRTSVNIVSFDHNNSKDVKKLCHLIYDNTTIDPKEEAHVGYSVEDLRRFAENTLLVVSSTDNTVSLWRFIVSKNLEIPEFADPFVRRYLTHFKFLYPVPCRVFTLSSTPELSFCYPLLSQSSSSAVSAMWRVSTLVNGIVIHIAEETKTSLSRNSDLQDLNEQKDPSLDCPQEGHSVESMTVLCQVHKPHHIGEYSRHYGVHTQFSWEIFNEWQNEFLLLPELAAGEEVEKSSLPTDTDKPLETIIPPEGLKPTEIEADSPLPLRPQVNPKLVEFGGQSPRPTAELVRSPKVIPRPPPHQGQGQGKKSTDSNAAASAKKLVSVFHNGIYMKVPQSEVKSLEKTNSRTATTATTAIKKKFVVTKDKTRPPTATPTPLGEMLEQDNQTESSGILLSVQTPIPRRAPSFSDIDISGFANFDFEVPQGDKTKASSSQDMATDIALVMSDDISTESSSLCCRIDLTGHGPFDEFEDHTPTALRKQGSGQRFQPTPALKTLGLATKAFQGNLGPSQKQPYRSAQMSVPLPTKLKEVYEPQVERFIANPAKVNPLLLDKKAVAQTGEGVSVYRTPATQSKHNHEHGLKHFFDGGLERVPNSDVLNSDTSKLLTFLQNPSSHFERLSSPLFYRMNNLEKILQRKQSSMQPDLDSMGEDRNTDEDDDEDDDDFSFTSELSVGGLSTASQIDAAKSLMADSERSVFESLDENAKLEFLLRKKEENLQIIRDSRRAFQSLLSNPPSLQSYPDSDDLLSVIEKSTLTSVSESEGDSLATDAKRNTVSMQKVMNWNKVEEATNAGVSQSQINEILQKTVSKKRKNIGDMRLNINQFTKFAKALNRAVIETQYPPEIKVSVTDTRSDMCDVSIESTKFGLAHVIIMKSSNSKDIPKPSDFDDLETLKFRYKGVAQIVSKAIHEKTTIEFTVKGLKPRTPYTLFCCAQHDNNDSKRIIRATDEMIEATRTRFRTEEPPPEVLELEWNRLKPIDQYDELAAAVFDVETQEKAQADGLQIPTIDSLEKWLDAVEEEDGDGEGSGNESEGSVDSITANVQDVKKFVRWWTGDEYGFSEVRTDFLRREAVFACGDGESIEKCEDEGFLTLEQSATLSSLVNEEDPAELLRSEEFIIFRSWLKGGRVIQKILDEKEEEKQEKIFEKKRKKLLAKESKIRELRLKKEAERESSDEENEADADLTAEEEKKTEEAEAAAEEEEEEEEDAASEGTDEDDPIAARFSDRSQRLQERSSQVEDAIKAIANLHMAYRHGHADGLSVRDLELKRGQLRMESITVIMAMKKLEELCDAKNIAVKDLEEDMYQLVSGASTFIEISEDNLKAEMPPHATLLTLLGQDKRPLRAWDKCTPYERELEIQLAGMITTILELAVEAGVSVPNIEDPYVLRGPNAQISRKTRWDSFEKWYVGNELHENQLKAMPTVARIMFTDWEKKHVKDDTKLRELIAQRQYETPQNTAAGASTKKKGNGVAGAAQAAARPIKRMATGDLGLTMSKSAVDEDEIVKIYELEVNKSGGEAFRCEILKKQVTSVLTSRNLSMMRLFWPPSGSSRPTSQFLFPRLGLIHPKYEEPVKRFRVFPSKSTETYSVEEVMAWYRSQELVEDDEMNKRNEQEGQKHQAYLNWLAEEEERMERGRLLMVDEDKQSARLRIHTRGIEVDRDLPMGKPRYRDFVFGNRLPGQYEELGTKTVKYDGSGVDNEDEVQDILEQMAKESELSLQHAKELKKKQLEDRKRKEEEDRIKQEKLERDQRIEENKDRLKKIRENFENIKLQRKLQEEEKQRELQEAELRRERELLAEAEAVRKEVEVKREEELRERERRLMSVEDAYHSYCREKAYDHRLMSAEDELGRVRREMDTRKEAKYRSRIKELEEIYEEHVPFQFEARKVRNKRFHYSELGEDQNQQGEGAEGEKSDEEIENEILLLLKRKRGEGLRGIPQEIKWSLFAKDRDNAGDWDGQQPEQQQQVLLELADSHTSLLSPIQPHPYLPPPSAGEAVELRVWPRCENLSEIAPPLIWSGPSQETEKKYSKLRKKPRPYTPLNPGEDQYANHTTHAIEPLEILLPQDGIVNPLEHLGMTKSMIRAMKRTRTRALPDVAAPLMQESLSESHLTRFPKLGTRTQTAAVAAPVSVSTSGAGGSVPPVRFQQPSFLKPLRYQSNLDAISISSPHETQAAVAMAIQTSSSESSPHHPRRLSSSPPPANLSSSLLQNQTAALASLIKRKKGAGSREGSDQLIQQIKTDREALRAFIASSSASASGADDRFYLEACRPGLRSRDSINSNQLVQSYRQSLLQSFNDNKSLHSGSALLSAVKESMDQHSNGNYGSVAQQQFPVVMSDSMSIPLVLNPAASAPTATFPHNHSPSASHDPLSDEISIDSNRQAFTHSQEISLHPTSLHPSDFILSDKQAAHLDQHHDRELERARESKTEPPFEPPFSRKLFGVRGQQKKIAELSPAFVANELVSAAAATGAGGGRLKLDTHKSKQRNEYSSLLRKTIESSRKSFNAADVNFTNNKGL